MGKLIKCSDCGREISKNAKTCPGCGAKNKKRTSIGTWLALGFIVLVIASIQRGNDLVENAQTSSPPPVLGWVYNHSDDPMSRGVTHTAMIQSSNTVNFSFPYNGEQHAFLILRTHPKHGKDVIFGIEKGQLLCPSYDGCKVQVRFDDGNAASFKATGAADNSTETIFIENYSQFVDKMMKAKRVRLSPDVYREGSPVFEFNVSGFDRNSYLPK